MYTTTALRQRALIVESAEVYRDLLHEMLQELGWTVDTAWNGLIGREMARRHEFDLVLCDLALPQHDAAETIASIRGQQPFARILALPAATALCDDPTLIAAYDRGADGVLHKPFGIYDLGKAIGSPCARLADEEILTAVREEAVRLAAPVVEWVYPEVAD